MNSTLSSLSRRWHEYLLENRQARNKLTLLKNIKSFGRLLELDIGLVKVPNKEELPDKLYDQLKEFGLMDEKLNGMVSFPLLSPAGKIINFLFLSINGKDDKILKHGGILNIKALSVFKQVVITDNIKDFLNYYTEVKENVVPLFHATKMPADVKEALARGNVNEIILLNSSPIYEYLKTEITELDIKIFDIDLPGKKTVEQFVKENSGQKLIAYIEAEKASIIRARKDKEDSEKKRFKVTEEIGEILFANEERKYRVRGFNKDGFEKIVQIVLEMEGKIFPDKIDLSRSQGRGKFSNIAGAEFEISSEIIREDLGFIYQHLDKLQDERFKEKSGLNKESLHIISKSEESKAIDYLTRRDILNETLIRDTERLGHVGEDINKKLYYVSAMSRLTEKVVPVLVIATSGSGKSFGLETVLQLIRPEGLSKYSRVTKTALYYKTEEELQNKIIFIEELVGMENAFESFRMLISSGYLSVSLTEKDQRTGTMHTVERKIRANVPVISSGTREYYDDETMSRFLITYNDESREQRERILHAQAHGYSLEGEKAYLHRDKILKRYRDFDFVFDPTLKVVNPYASRIMINPDLPIVTRKQEQYLRLMYNIAFIRQHNKKRKDAEDRYGNKFTYVEVDRFDVETANEIAAHVFQFVRGDLTKRLAEAYQVIENYCIDQVKEKKINLYEYRFSRREIREYASWDVTRARRIFTELENLEYIRKVRGRKSGMTYLYALVPYKSSSKNTADLNLLNLNNL